MKKAHKKYRNNKTIKTRLIITLFLICTIPILVLGFVSYKKAYNILYNKLQVTTIQNLSLVNNVIDNYFLGMENIITIVSSNKNFKELGKHPDFEELDSNLLKNIKDSNKDILAIYFAENTGKLIVPSDQG